MSMLVQEATKNLTSTSLPKPVKIVGKPWQSPERNRKLCSAFLLLKMPQNRMLLRLAGLLPPQKVEDEHVATPLADDDKIGCV
jgi:hypothetical protein